jgi:CRISPR-associated protein Cmr2
MSESHRVLLLGDVDAIKEYVFESSSLPQIRGGSQLLLECERLVQEEVKQAGGETIYCAGGSFLFEVPQDLAARLQQAIERIYREHTGLATVTVVAETALPTSVSPSLPQDGWAGRLATAARGQAPLDGGFAHRVALLAAHLRRAKDQKVYAPHYQALPFTLRCQTCGKRPAESEIPRREPAQSGPVEWQALCGVCRSRHVAGLAGDSIARGAWNAAFQRTYRPRARQAPDLDHLVQSAKRGYIAFLYADGNNIGGLLQQATTPEHYRTLSQALFEAGRHAIFNALATACQPVLNRDGFWPFDIVNVGGDDVAVLVQAGYAWEVAVHFLEAFEREVQVAVQRGLGGWPAGWPARVTASCGIAVADARYPVRYLRALAEDLLRSAKRLSQREQDTPQSTLDFLWLTNPVLSDQVEPLRARYDRGNFSLTARPYRLDQARQLRELAAEAATLPRSQRHLWGQALERGVLVSLNTIYYNVARRPDHERLKLSQFLNEVGQLCAGSPRALKDPVLWRIDPDEPALCRTALLDVLELAELESLRPDVHEAIEVPS